MLDAAPRFILVDGHSVIHAWPELRKLHRQSSRRYMAREALIKQMRLVQDMTGAKVVLVFDGTQDKASEERNPEDIQIFYSDSSHTADSIIERLAAKYASLYSLRIVSADSMIWQTVRAFGADWMSPDDLSFILKQAEETLRHKLKA